MESMCLRMEEEHYKAKELSWNNQQVIQVEIGVEEVREESWEWDKGTGEGGEVSGCMWGA